MQARAKSSAPHLQKGARVLADERAFDEVVVSPLAGRSGKPRTHGETMILDKGLGLSQTGDLLELTADYIDYVKS
jgi:phosphosulfolactate synthase